MNELTWEELERLVNEQENGEVMGQDTDLASTDATATSNTDQLSSVGEVSEVSSDGAAVIDVPDNIITFPNVAWDTGVITFPSGLPLDDSASTAELLESVGVDTGQEWVRANEPDPIVMTPLSEQIEDESQGIDHNPFVLDPEMRAVFDQIKDAEINDQDTDVDQVNESDQPSPPVVINDTSTRRRGRPKKVVIPPTSVLVSEGSGSSEYRVSQGVPVNTDVPVNGDMFPKWHRMGEVSLTVNVQINGDIAYIMAMLAHINRFGKE